MSDNPKGAILQRDKQTYAIVPRTPVGLVTPDDLENIARIGFENMQEAILQDAFSVTDSHK